MIKVTSISFLLILFMSCNPAHREDSEVIITKVIPCNNIEGTDSLLVVTTEGKDLFKIAMGGNVELLRDTLVNINGEETVIFTLADYFQDNQIFYVIYNRYNSMLWQTDKMYLPYIGLDIGQYDQVNYQDLTKDSLYMNVEHRPTDIISLAIDTLQVNEEGIINYYEFE